MSGRSTMRFIRRFVLATTGEDGCRWASFRAHEVFAGPHNGTSRLQAYGMGAAIRVLVSSATNQAAPHALVGARRGVVQSNRNTGLRSVLDQYGDAALVHKLSANKNGNYYRFQSKLWRSAEMLEVELTKMAYSPVERAPPQLLPQLQTQRESARVGLITEGRGATALLENAASTVAEETRYQASSLAELLADDADGCAVAAQSINDKIVTDDDVYGTLLESAAQSARRTIEEDMQSNALVTPRDTLGSALRILPQDIRASVTKQSAKDPGGAIWESLGLDPVLSSVAVTALGPTATRLQCRLLPALLNEDHNDVVFNGVTGSGKTSALLLALLQGVRSESAGMSVFVASNTMNAMRAYDLVKELCRKAGAPSRGGRGMGGALVDRPQDDYSWLVMCTFREDHRKCFMDLKATLGSDHGPARLLITTADVFCELFFQHKMEFEPFGYLRRVYLDDIGQQVPLLSETAPVEEVKERLRNPLAAELLLATLHQLPGPHIRSILQLGLVSADLDAKLKDHLLALCVKPQAKTVCLVPVQLPTTIHCLFSFHLHHEDVYEYMTSLIRRVDSTIPGRAVIFVRQEHNVLEVRQQLRQRGMDAKIFSEVYRDGSYQPGWKFLLLKESEAYGVDLPLVSHVFITFVPRTGHSFQHMAGRCGRLGNYGWVYTICDRQHAKPMRQIVEQVHVDFVNHVVDRHAQVVDPASVESLTKECTLYPLDPQYVVNQHHIVQSENPDFAHASREFFSKPVVKQFQREDYTPRSVLHRRHVNSKKVAVDVDRDPSVVLRMQEQRYLDRYLRPTKRLIKALGTKSRKYHPAPY